MVDGARSDNLRVFISYSRRDAVAADALVEGLITRGLEVTIDRRDLPFGEEWQAELADFIRLSDTVVWLVSEASIHSSWVNWELDEVARRSKRLVPVMIDEVKPAQLPRQLGMIQILPRDRVFDLARDLDSLVGVLETDYAWLKEASRLQDRATEWLRKGRSSAFLLSRSALTDAERWKDRHPPKAPSPAQEVLDLLLASRQASTRRQQWWLGGATAIALGAFALAGVAYWQSIEAERQAGIASAQRDAANLRRLETEEVRRQAQIAESGLLSVQSDLRTDDKVGSDSGTAVLLAIEALPDETSSTAREKDRPWVAEAEFQLERGLRNLRESAAITGHISEAVFLGKVPHIFVATDKQSYSLLDLKNRKIAYQLKESAGKILKATFSADYGRVLTVHDDHTARIWSLTDGSLHSVLKGHTGRIYSASLNRDGSIAMTASEDKTIKLWATGVGQLTSMIKDTRTEIFEEKDAELRTLLSPDGARLLTITKTIGGGEYLRLWDTSSGRIIQEFNYYASVKFSHDGKLFAFSGMDYFSNIYFVAVLDAANGRVVAMLEGHKGDISSIQFNHDSTRIVTSSRDKTAAVWDARSGVQLLALKGHEDIVTDTSLNGDGTQIATISTDGTIRLWSMGSGAQTAILRGHGGRISSIHFSRDGKRVISTSHDRTARVWDAASGIEIARLEGHLDIVSQASLSSEGEWAVTYSQDGTTRVWEIDPQGLNSAKARSGIRLIGHRGDVLTVHFSSDGKYVATSSIDQTVRVWDAERGNQVAFFEVKCPIGEWVAMSGCITSRPTFNKSSDLILAGLADNTVLIWSIPSGREMMKLRGHEGPVRSATFSQDGRFVITASEDNTVKIWDIATGRQLLTTEKLTNSVRDATFSPNGLAFVTRSQGHDLDLWDATNGRKIESVETDLDWMMSFAIGSSLSPDRRWFLSRLENGVSLRELASDREVARVEIEKDEFLLEAGFYPKGKRFYTLSNSGPLRIWDFSTDNVKVVANLGGARSAALDTEGTQIVLAEGQVARILRLSPTSIDLTTDAKSRAPRCLTPDQRRTYFLPQAPPLWCVKRRLWPYHGDAWQAWLAARASDPNTPLPKTR